MKKSKKPPTPVLDPSWLILSASVLFVWAALLWSNSFFFLLLCFLFRFKVKRCSDGNVLLSWTVSTAMLYLPSPQTYQAWRTLLAVHSLHKSHLGCGLELKQQKSFRKHSAWVWLQGVEVATTKKEKKKPLALLAYMTDSIWDPHTPEAGAKSTVRRKNRPPAHQTKLYSQCNGQQEEWKERRKEKKSGNSNRKDKSYSASVISADKRTNCKSALWLVGSKLAWGPTQHCLYVEILI